FGLDEAYVQSGALYYKAFLGEREFFFLDTTDYQVSEVQQAWLKAAMKDRKGPLLVFMHHPPALMGTPFMDAKYPLRNWADMQALFLDYPEEVLVFSGHYHLDKSVHL
ncbi:metallophosphoesterase, partial [Arthrospira platensis SPKY1]|nr:metallophosphoesterase [Arthrospira platensis SPKY1]